MRKLLGSRRKALTSPTLATALMDVEDQKWSGSITVPGTARDLRVFVFEGGAYSCLVDDDPGFGSDDRLVRRRMQASGVNPDSRESDRIMQRGSIHQERLFAFLGQAASSRIDVYDEGSTTSHHCALPLAWSMVQPVLAAREARWRLDVAALPVKSVSGFAPGAAQVVATSRELTGVPEHDFFLESVRQPQSIDFAAYSCGFTRAEAVHIVATLVSVGLLNVVDTSREDGHPLTVPEAWTPAQGT